MARRRYRRAVVIESQEGEVGVVAREVEIVRVTAEEGRGSLGREHQPHIGIAAVNVETILTALVQADHLAQVGLTARTAGRALDYGHGAAACSHIGLAGLAGHGVHNRCGDVGYRLQLISLQAGAGFFLASVDRHHAVLDQVVLGTREVLHAVGNTVMVGKHQPLGRDH